MVVFCSPSRYFIQAVQDSFLPHPCQFIIHSHPAIQHYITYAVEKVSLNNVRTSKHFVLDYQTHLVCLYVLFFVCLLSIKLQVAETDTSRAIYKGWKC